MPSAALRSRAAALLAPLLLLLAARPAVAVFAQGGLVVVLGGILGQLQLLLQLANLGNKLNI